MIKLENPTWEEMIEYRDALIKSNDKLFQYVQDVPGVYLNLGCGWRDLRGFYNVDRYLKPGRVTPIEADMFRLPFKSDSTDLIFMCHSLEHLPIRQAVPTLKECYRVLKNGSKMIIEIPDLDIIMAILLDQNLSDEQHRWFIYTLFGYQADSTAPDTPDVAIDYGQFHTNGFSKKRIHKQLLDIGFEVQELYSYEGYGTPGIRIDVIKTGL
jgi:SAM-dependent methyltransferase